MWGAVTGDAHRSSRGPWISTVIACARVQLGMDVFENKGAAGLGDEGGFIAAHVPLAFDTTRW